MYIGPSTGWLYASKIYTTKNQQAFFKSVGANAVEVFLGITQDIRVNNLLRGETFDPEIFKYLSLHLPQLHLFKNKALILKKIKEIMDKQQIKRTCIHPSKLSDEDYQLIIDSGIPLSLENMDCRTTTIPEEFKELISAQKKFDCYFVLDVQHAYEHDSSMQYAQDLFEMMGPVLTHLHVSGETENQVHTRVCESNNRGDIVEFLNKNLPKKKVPLILEGKYQNVKELKDEIQFLKKELTF